MDKSSSEFVSDNTSYGSEGEFVGKISGKGGSVYGMQRNGNGNGDSARLILDSLLKYSSLVVYPICLILFGLWTQNASLDKRLSLIEDRAKNVPVDIGMIKDIAIFQDRQSFLMRKTESNDARLDKLEIEFEAHRQKSTYDPLRK